MTARIFAIVPVTIFALGAATALAQPAPHPFARFAATQAGCSLGVDNLLTKRMVPVFRYDGSVPRALTLAS
jgi:hypothetical protein